MVSKKQERVSSKDAILNAVKRNQPPLVSLPDHYTSEKVGGLEVFTQVLEGIGGKVHLLDKDENVAIKVKELFPDARRMVSSITSVDQYFLKEYADIKHHSLHDVDVVIIESTLGVAENGSVWVTGEETKIRVLPFIGEHLVVVLPSSSIVSTMHDAYNIISNDDYDFGVFIAGPSKTADIEQSLVLGAHGPKSMTILVLM
ncbi:MAG TPA: LUD domain-containing protein [Chitinophagaceae bacterium]|nr:LUD domain-containing protein [Chitinophagaceae bacterium]